MFGLMLIAINFLYLVFSLIVGIITYVILSKKEKFTRPKRFGISVGTFLVVWMLPFWDLLLQKGIKTYYETFMMDSQIYAYPEKDKDGKIESLGVGEVDLFTLGRFAEHLPYGKVIFTSVDPKDMKIRSNGELELYGRYIKNFIEIGVFDDAHTTKLFRITYAKEPSIIRIPRQSARYQVRGVKHTHMFGLYTEFSFIFEDTKSKKILAEAKTLIFPPIKNEFRNKYLLFRGPSGSPLKIGNLINSDETFKKVFGFPMNISVYDVNYNNQGESK